MYLLSNYVNVTKIWCKVFEFQILTFVLTLKNTYKMIKTISKDLTYFRNHSLWRLCELRIQNSSLKIFVYDCWVMGGPMKSNANLAQILSHLIVVIFEAPSHIVPSMNLHPRVEEMEWVRWNSCIVKIPVRSKQT